MKRKKVVHEKAPGVKVTKEEPVAPKAVVAEASGSRVPQIMANIHRAVGLEAYPDLSKQEKSDLKNALDAQSLSETTFKDLVREARREQIRKQLSQ